MSDPVKPAVPAVTSWADEEEEYEDGYDPSVAEPEPEPAVQLPPTPSHLSRGNLSRQSSAQSVGALSRQSSQGSLSGEPSRQIPNRGPFKAFIGNLPFTLQDAEIQSIFVGMMNDIHWFTNDEGRRNGRCIIEFETRQHLIDALQKDNTQVGGRAIRVDIASKGQGGNRGGRGGSHHAAGGSQDERNYHQRDTRDSRGDSRGGQQRDWNNTRQESSGHAARSYGGGFERERSYQSDRRDTRDTRDTRYNDKPRREVSVPRRDSDAERDRPAPLVREVSSTSTTSVDLPSGANTPAAGRPKLKLAPRTVATPTAAAAEIQDTKGIFGGARPTNVRETMARTDSNSSIASDSPVASPANANQAEHAASNTSSAKSEISSSPSHTVRLVEGPVTSLDAPDAIKQTDRRPTHQQRGGRPQQSSARNNDRTQHSQPQQSSEDNDWQQRGGNSKSNARGSRTIGRGGAAAQSNATKKQAEADDMSKPITNTFAALSMDED